MLGRMGKSTAVLMLAGAAFAVRCAMMLASAVLGKSGAKWPDSGLCVCVELRAAPLVSVVFLSLLCEATWVTSSVVLHYCLDTHRLTL